MSSVSDLLECLYADDFARAHIVHNECLPARDPEWAEFPEWLHPALPAVLACQGRTRLYRHQREACDLARAGHDILIVTPTASGKSLGCHLPVLDRLLRDPRACALYLAPTKALAQDQSQELQRLAAALPLAAGLGPEQIAVYDGDTPQAARRAIRGRVRLLISNPDMLHFAILPQHAQAWHRFLAHLDCVVVDEIHAYRGVFGSHVANVFRRLQRLCLLHAPRKRVQFLCASATVANEEALARRLLERPVQLVKRNGAPRGEKRILFFNPPILNSVSGWRDAAGAVCHIARLARQAAVPSLIFAQTRMEVERLLTDLRHQSLAQGFSPAQAEQLIRGYRGGYLPAQRRAVEQGLRDGSLMSVVTTNALELGIDIGLLQCVIMMRYPGTIAGTWQQIGRAGRRQETSLAVFVASRNAVDQYLIGHPEFLLEGSPEFALLNPDHPHLLLQHLRCALAEQPVSSRQMPADPYGQGQFMQGALDYLVKRRHAYRKRGRWFYMGRAHPSREVNLRNMGHAFTIAVHGQDSHGQLLGTLEEDMAPVLAHPGAIYMHEGQKYLVETLDCTAREARVRAMPHIDWHTESISAVDVSVRHVHEHAVRAGAVIGCGEVEVSAQVVGFRKLHRYQEGQNVMGPAQLALEAVDCPVRTFRTQAYWIQIPRATQQKLEAQNRWRDSRNDYGPQWEVQRRRARERYGTRCSRCGRSEMPGRAHDVHHIRPFRTFGYVRGRNRNDIVANALENLCILCRPCHRLVEPVQGVRGLAGLVHALGNTAPFHLMCDPSDLGLTASLAENRPGDSSRRGGVEGFDASLATLYIHERFMGGLGFSRILFSLHAQLMKHADRLVRDCPCRYGCPVCVGPAPDGEGLPLGGVTRKELTVALLAALREGPP